MLAASDTAGTPFGVADPVVFPAEAVENPFEKLAAIDVHESAFAGNEAGDFASAGGGEVVGGLVGFAAGAVAGNDEAGIDDGANERDAFADGLGFALVGMKGEIELVVEVFFDNADVAHELVFLRHRDDDVEIIDVATVMFVAELEGDETVELVEEDIRDELAGEVADDDAMAGFAIEEAFVGGEGGPFFLRAADDNAAHGVVVDDLMPEKLGGLVELVTVVRAAGDAVFGKIIGWESARVDATLELAVEAPADAFV